MGARDNNEDTTSIAFQLRYEFRGQNSFKGERIVTPQIMS